MSLLAANEYVGVILACGFHDVASVAVCLDQAERLQCFASIRLGIRNEELSCSLDDVRDEQKNQCKRQEVEDVHVCYQLSRMVSPRQSRGHCKSVSVAHSVRVEHT